MPRKSPFLSFVVPTELLRQIDDYRFKYRFQTRAATIKYLLRCALELNPEPPNGEDQVP